MIVHFFTSRIIHSLSTSVFFLYILFAIYSVFDTSLQLTLFAITPLVIIVGLVDALILFVIAFQYVVLNSLSLYSFIGAWLIVLSIATLSVHDLQSTLLPLGVIPIVSLYILCIWELGVRYYLVFQMSDKRCLNRHYLLSAPFLLLIITILSLLAINTGVYFFEFKNTVCIEYFLVILIARVLLHLTVETNHRDIFLTSDHHDHFC